MTPLIRQLAILSLAAFLFFSGCVTPIRASNRSFAPNDRASARFPGNTDQAVVWLSTAFESMGFPAHAQYGRTPNTVYVFEGIRNEIPGQVYWGRRGRAPLMGSTVEIGSIFYAYLRPSVDGTATEITVLGKPMVAGHQACAEDDDRWNLPCEDLEGGEAWRRTADIDGSAEAAVVRELLALVPAQDAARGVASTSLPTFLPPSTLPKPTSVFGECEFSYATGSHFQRNYCPDGDKTLVDQDNQIFKTGGREGQPCIPNGKGGCQGESSF